MKRIDFSQDLVRQFHVHAADVLMQLRERRCADQRAGRERTAVHERERELRRAQAVTLRELDIGADRLDRVRLAVSLKTLEQGDTPAVGTRAAFVLAGQPAERHWRISKQTDAFLVREFREPGFERTVHQAVWIL